jgi:hypothetical protein
MSEISRCSLWKRLGAIAAFLGTALLYQPAKAVTTVSVEGKTIVIRVPIDVRGLQGAKVRDVVTGEIFDAAPYIEREVERIWNEAFQGFSFDCWKFRLDLELFAIGRDWIGTKGHHDLSIKPKEPRSYWDSTGPDDLCADCDFPFAYSRDMTGVINTPDSRTLAHEVGHAMGLGDDYFKGGGYKPEAAGVGYEAGVRFLDSNGEEIERGSFMTRGVGRPDAVYLWRIVAMMKEAGVLPPCPCASGVRWNGTMQQVHQPGGEHRVTTQVKVQLCETRRYPLPSPPVKGMVDVITLEDAGSIVTRRHWADPNWTSKPCIYSGQGTSAARSPAGEIFRTLEDVGRRGELRWSAPTYYVSLGPTKSPDYTSVCTDDRGTQTTKYEGGSGDWSLNSGPQGQLPLEGGRMVGGYSDSPQNFVGWSICRDGGACPPAPENPNAPSGDDDRRAGGPPPAGPSSAPAGSSAAPGAAPLVQAPAAQAPAAPTPSPPPRGGGWFRP